MGDTLENAVYIGSDGVDDVGAGAGSGLEGLEDGLEQGDISQGADDALDSIVNGGVGETLEDTDADAEDALAGIGVGNGASPTDPSEDADEPEPAYIIQISHKSPHSVSHVGIYRV